MTQIEKKGEDYYVDGVKILDPLTLPREKREKLKEFQEKTKEVKINKTIVK